MKPGPYGCIRNSASKQFLNHITIKLYLCPSKPINLEKMKKLSFLVFLIAAALGLNAQSNFLLYSFKGNVSVVENGAETKAKIGKMLNSNATVKVAAGGAVT